MQCHILPSVFGTPVFFTGPDLSLGPMPALFYFSLSGEESLCLEPYNSPISLLSSRLIRIFSLHLPGHEMSLEKAMGLAYWAQEIKAGNDVIAEFVGKLSIVVERLLQQDVLIPGKIAVAGLSRGAFIATHAAAAIKDLDPILGFAPLTDLRLSKEFQEIHHLPLLEALDLTQLVDPLIGRTLRFYIGNCDSLVGTDRCFRFIERLSQAAYHKRIRSPQVELFITPSIGHRGHGTSPEIFQSGSAWIAKMLEAPT
ncbi:MAG: alpha/beta hydrolase [Anaerolineae bacterium]